MAGLALKCDPTAAFAPFAGRPHSLLLHSGGAGPSFLYADPVETFIARASEERPADPEPFFAEARANGAYVAGLVAYEWGGPLNQAPRAPGSAWPDLAFGAYDARLEISADGDVTVQGAAEPGGRLLEAAAAGVAPPASSPERVQFAPLTAREGVEAATAALIARIHAGDLYQANFSHPFAATLAQGDAPYAAWARLVAHSPAPYAGFFRLSEGLAVGSNSPELFLSVSPEGLVTTRPIKGTRPRSAEPVADAALAQALAASAKDRAENLMIVDLMRNDLARACEPGSVKTPALFEVESYANVHHLVSTVVGRLSRGCGLGGLLARTFPPGSITGAPKRQAMVEIARLEGRARGPYCGAMGHIAPDGAATFNVMIRTMAFSRDGDRWRAEARAGGGVVADSEPADEYEETLAKIASIRAALSGS